MSRGVEIRLIGRLAQVSLRADATDQALAARLAEGIGASLPTAPGTVASAPDGERHALWLGPDEWLVVGPDGSAPSIERAIRDASADALVTTVDASANRVGIDVVGPAARELLGFGCSIDLDPPAFGPDRCAQTLLARAAVIIWGTGGAEATTYRILVRPSFAGYLGAWLADATDGLADRPG
jgi:sarcosine oxidase subunit gamma